MSAPPSRVLLKKQSGTFGFDLHELQNRPGHFIGHVAPDSPAAKAGITVEQQLIEVNGESVVRDSHDEVVRKLKHKSDEVELLLVGKDARTVEHSNALWVETGNQETVIMVPTSPKADSSAPGKPHTCQRYSVVSV